jgi:ketosteroid isomerase-like protein
MRAALVTAVAAVQLSCASAPANETQGDLIAEARSFYASYEAALRAGQRERLASFYTADGALLQVNGQRMRLTSRGIDSVYRGAGWRPPAFFAFDRLEFDRVSDRDVMATGTLRWLDTGSSDTAQVAYTAILRRVDNRFAIRTEHETVLTRTNPLVGTWELVSTLGTRNDTTFMQGGPPDIRAIKILNATHYAVITRRGGQFMRAGGGRYTLSGNTYTEMVDISSGQDQSTGVAATFTVRLEGDTWTTEGGTSTTRFREVWRRAR